MKKQSISARGICSLLILLMALPVASLAAEDAHELIELLDAVPAYANGTMTTAPMVSESAFVIDGRATDNILSDARVAPGFFRPVLMQRGEGRGRRDREERRNERNGQDDRPGQPGWRGRPMPPPGMGRGPMPPPAWMDQLKDLPPDEQEKVLRNSERFQELPKERQEQLIQRLHRFQELPPDQKDMIMQRFGAFNRLSPEQRQKTRELLPRWSELPPDRRNALQDEFRKMRGMSPEDRDKYLSGRELEGKFSADERDLLKQLNSLEPPFPPPPPRGGMPGPRPFPRDRRR